MKNIITFLLFAGFCSFSQAQSRHYVHASATGANNGQTWTDAYTDLQSALQIAQAGDEIWVAKGTYFPTQDADRTVSFEPTSGVKLYGGFVGSETEISQRDWQTNETILSGDIGIVGDSTDNSYTVMYLFQPDSNTVVDGFSLCFGVANDSLASGTRDRTNCGGGLYIEAGNWDAFPTIQHCRFWRNTALSFGGGGMTNGTSSASVAPRFVDCRFEENRSFGSGGGMARLGGSWADRGVEYENCQFYYNQAGLHGGGLYYNDTRGPNMVSLSGCQFKNNQATNFGGGASLIAGKLGQSGLDIQHCVFEANSSIQGAAFHIFNNGNEFDGEANIDSCKFIKNKAYSGSGSSILYADQFGFNQSVVRLSNLHFDQNESSAQIIFLGWLYADIIIENTKFKDNICLGRLLTQTEITSSQIQNCIFQYNEIESFANFNFIDTQTVLKLSHCLFEKNRSSWNDGLFTSSNLRSISICNSAFLYEDHLVDEYDSFIFSDTDSLIISNTILTDSLNKWSFTSNSSNLVFLTHNYFGFLDCNDQFPNVICGPGNLFGLDPMFRDTANGDYSLLPCSPLINAGSNAAAAGILTDLAGNPRILEGTVDIGAYEAPAFALAAAPAVSPACVGSDGGSIALQPINGCEPYTYAWMPNAGTGPELNGLPAGAYQITLTDASGRQIMDTVLVPEAPQPNLSLATANVQCGNPAGGALTAVVNNGTAPFSYQWLPVAADTAMLQNLPAGAYSLTLTDANGCQDSTSASIALLGALSLSVDGMTIPCYGETGWLSAAPANGAAPFQYQWSGWAGTDSLAQPLTPGNYAVTVSDAYGCTSSFVFPVMTQPDSLSIGTGSDPQSQLNPPNGLALVTTISGGTSPFAFDWNTMDMTQAITGLEAGTYTVTVSDTNGCTATAEVVVDFTIGTQDIDHQALVLSPNPATDWVQVYLPAGEWQVELLDASGRVLRTQSCGGEDCVLDLAGLSAGSYVVRVRNAQKWWLGRVLKQ